MKNLLAITLTILSLNAFSAPVANWKEEARSAACSAEALVKKAAEVSATTWKKLPLTPYLREMIGNLKTQIDYDMSSSLLDAEKLTSNKELKKNLCEYYKSIEQINTALAPKVTRVNEIYNSLLDQPCAYCPPFKRQGLNEKTDEIKEKYFGLFLYVGMFQYFEDLKVSCDEKAAFQSFFLMPALRYIAIRAQLFDSADYKDSWDNACRK